MIPVVFCSWKRVQNVPLLVDLILNQKGVEEEIRVFIWNNNKNEQERLAHYTSQWNNGQVVIFNSEKNIGGFGRFYLARNLVGIADKVIFFDDDQIIRPDVISTFLSCYKPRQIASWWGWFFKSGYWNRERVTDGSLIHYAGTGGMLCDISIFEEDGLFECPEKYWFAEDLWLSYYAQHCLGWDLIGISAGIRIEVDGLDQYHGMKKLKPEFLEYLRGLGWKI